MPQDRAKNPAAPNPTDLTGTLTAIAARDGIAALQDHSDNPLPFAPVACGVPMVSCAGIALRGMNPAGDAPVPSDP